MTERVAQRRADLRSKFDRALHVAAHQCQRILARYPHYAPIYTVAGQWNRETHRPQGCEGYFPGLLWMLVKHHGETAFRQPALQATRRIEAHQKDANLPELGLLFGCSVLRYFRLSGDPTVRDALIRAGQTLAMRARRQREPTDQPPECHTMERLMNAQLMLWVAHEIGDLEIERMALDLARALQHCLLRPDGTAMGHRLWDAANQQSLEPPHSPSFAQQSAWSRGLAWAILGFTGIYRHTHDPEWLRVANRCADAYLQRAEPLGWVPWWDFEIPEDGPRLVDSSAAAIAASALWDLSEEQADPADRERHQLAACAILESLCSPTYLAEESSTWEGILRHGIAHYPKQLAVDESLIWGDHYFVEAVLKARAGRADAAW
ncbi:glucuronyl hydrolase [Tuwongella immobilis]|uniref:Glucuronyl hydrolase n=1 Tax=Tuwongella immobilis TaxID=692036 RepID=A0A6C2YUM0_9BACT|nr:glucuronyl hydrolase [Tuwongella immobilis]VIP04562.1 glucuronyl hydrolase : Putative unsaturated glucuronyl hydrolase OS=Singulisphaera acidiphila (strain ATCC BAA-1392 / DSM 18658 / VKM B-2454 / MOB10) GN=Sinac_0734 PE=4 SV=1: Glyco_hydro_88 [Tuwongella immobilis]VTS06485.1 glucuronyl hydrolase : Putative unsaturated glucuronyl hydrolase OS=Singulisphaera acidiphila (strain ATCC BAA-1392 / DSM 18658 / VKM B-2454 / MOB10) GN=Sinac_0734 PE=4 SV=1: Glyco_hydro_88 [Tuwongella immobilis]